MPHRSPDFLLAAAQYHQRGAEHLQSDAEYHQGGAECRQDDAEFRLHDAPRHIRRSVRPMTKTTAGAKLRADLDQALAHASEEAGRALEFDEAERHVIDQAVEAGGI